MMSLPSRTTLSETAIERPSRYYAAIADKCKKYTYSVCILLQDITDKVRFASVIVTPFPSSQHKPCCIYNPKLNIKPSIDMAYEKDRRCIGEFIFLLATKMKYDVLRGRDEDNAGFLHVKEIIDLNEAGCTNVPASIYANFNSIVRKAEDKNNYEHTFLRRFLFDRRQLFHLLRVCGNTTRTDLMWWLNVSVADLAFIDEAGNAISDDTLLKPFRKLFSKSCLFTDVQIKEFCQRIDGVGNTSLQRSDREEVIIPARAIDRKKQHEPDPELVISQNMNDMSGLPSIPKDQIESIATIDDYDSVAILDGLTYSQVSEICFDSPWYPIVHKSEAEVHKRALGNFVTACLLFDYLGIDHKVLTPTDDLSKHYVKVKKIHEDKRIRDGIKVLRVCRYDGPEQFLEGEPRRKILGDIAQLSEAFNSSKDFWIELARREARRLRDDTSISSLATVTPQEFSYLFHEELSGMLPSDVVEMGAEIYRQVISDIEESHANAMSKGMLLTHLASSRYYVTPYIEGPNSKGFQRYLADPARASLAKAHFNNSTRIPNNQEFSRILDIMLPYCLYYVLLECDTSPTRILDVVMHLRRASPFEDIRNRLKDIYNESQNGKGDKYNMLVNELTQFVKSRKDTKDAQMNVLGNLGFGVFYRSRWTNKAVAGKTAQERDKDVNVKLKDMFPVVFHVL